MGKTKGKLSWKRGCSVKDKNLKCESFQGNLTVYFLLKSR